jgi:chorismate dehydratase
MSSKLSIVNYINTLPFLWGLDRASHPFLIQKKIPSLCGEDFISGAADICLIPTGFLPHLTRDYRYITGHGIACTGAVRTVKLLSNKPLEAIEHIALDDHSTTSSSLLRILCKFYWNIGPEFVKTEIIENSIYDAVLMIGDKVFANEEHYKYHYDLGEVWKTWTNKPFVFAIWIGSDNVENKNIEQLTKIFSKSIRSLSDIIDAYQPDFPAIDLNKYLSGNIEYRLSQNHMEGLEKYLDYINQLELELV